MQKRTRKIDTAFMALWAAILLASPLFKASAKFFGWPDFQRRAVEENRILTQRPDLRHTPARQWGRATDAWYDDNFAWRADIIRLYKIFLFSVAKQPYGELVPGSHGMVFRRREAWPEIDDYLGAIAVDEEMRQDWRTYFEGRVTWAKAHGANYLEAVAPVKAQVHPEYAPWTIRNMKGHSSRLQLMETLKGSFAETNVLFFTDDFRREVESGREMFYQEDHHVNPYGCWRLYYSIIGRMRELWYPWLTITPYYEDPPDDVLNKSVMGAYPDLTTRRLVVSAPGYHPCDVPGLGIMEKNPRFPQCPAAVRRDGEGLYLAMRSDSLMRFALSSWRAKGDVSSLAVPFGDGFSDIVLFIFQRFQTKDLERLVAPRVPDVILEEFPECKISLGVYGLDDTMRRAAEFGRARQFDGGDGGVARALALGVFENPKPAVEGGKMRAMIIDADGRTVASQAIAPGVRRAVFFGAVEGRTPFTAALGGGSADAQRIELRRAP